jgi:hypothetical protein
VNRLTFRERWRMSWELTWPLALMDAAVMVAIHGVIEAQGETLDSIWAVVAFLAASPWVVHRALARRYGAWDIIVRSGEQERARLNYTESFKAMWLLAWRTLPLALLAALAISALLRLLRIPTSVIDTQDPLANALGLSIVDSVASLVLTPFLIPGMLRKKYRGFRLELKEFVPPPPVKKPRKR